MEDKNIKEKKELLEYSEEKSLLYKLKRWEKNLIKYLKNLFSKKNDEKTKEHIKIMEEQKKYYDNELKKENDNFEKASKKIEEEKKKEIDSIENNKNKKIEEDNKKYNDIIIYLESIKNDREKIIEFFKSNNIF